MRLLNHFLKRVYEFIECLQNYKWWTLRDDKRLTGPEEVKMGNAKCNCDKIEGPCHSYWEPGWMTECVWMKQKSGIAHNCTASCWRAQLSTNRGALRTFLPLVIPQWASAHLTVHQRSRFYKLHSDLVTITRHHTTVCRSALTSLKQLNIRSP